jgi:hypothetical protein
MNMDLGSTLIGVFSIIIIALPFIIMMNNRKKKEKKALYQLTELAKQNNCQIGQYELFDRFSIGIDESKKIVFFNNQTNDKEIQQAIKLFEIKLCKVINSSRTFNGKGGNQKVIDKLELCFTPKIANQPEIKLEFYNAEVSIQLNGQLQAIEKWSKLINEHLKHNK